MADYSQLMLKHFSSQFNKDIVCFFRQGYVDSDLDYDVGPSYINMSTDTIQAEKPDGSVFMYVNVIEGVTNNGSIGSNILQLEPFTLQFRVYTPSGMSFKKETEVSDDLDLIFKRKDFVFGQVCINSDTATPKTSSKMLADAEDGYNVLTINYNYECRYFD